LPILKRLVADFSLKQAALDGVGEAAKLGFQSQW
jgi:hypothetical protein